jgi:DNA-binding MarR family transcriptional regulator
MSSPDSRDELVAAVLSATRKESGQAALFSQAVAERLGLAGIDVECLDVLLEEGPTTVGRLADLTSLTTGSATRMIDRLEQGGFVRRIADPADRRRVLVEPVAGLGAKLGALHAAIADSQRQVIESYGDDQLRLLADFLNRSAEIARRETARMRAPSEEAGAGGSFAARVGGVTAGRLVFISGAPTMSIRGDASLSDLYRAEFTGSVPRVRVRDGVVTVGYPRFGWFDWRAQIADQGVEVSAHWRKDVGEIALNPAVPWSIELRGGASSLSADVRTLRLESFEMRGGAGSIELVLPRPSGVVPIKVTGGMNRLSIQRPIGTAAGLEFNGGAGEVKLDGERIKGTGSLAVQTPEAASFPDRYEIQITGGARKISVSTY